MLKKHKHLTQEERWHIYMQKGSRNSIRNIAKSLNRDPSVISREIKRNSVNQSFKSSECKIRLLWNPEQISGRLKAEGMACVSYETIYKMIWKNKQNGGDLYRCLRHGGKKYNKRSGKNSGRDLIPNRIDIELRDQIVEEKSRIGDLESDTVIGANHKGAIVTLVDRMSKFSLFTLVPDKTKESVTKAIESSLGALKKIILTITFDNGKEFAGH